MNDDFLALLLIFHMFAETLLNVDYSIHEIHDLISNKSSVQIQLEELDYGLFRSVVVNLLGELRFKQTLVS